MSLRSAGFVVALVAALAAPPAATGQPADAPRLAAAKNLMEIAGVARQFDELMPLLMRQLAQSFLAIAPDKSEEIQQVFAQLNTRFIDRKGELIDQIAAVYAEKLTLDDLTAIVAFYKSPVGTKFVSLQPDIMRQSMILGQRWGAQIGREVEEEARRELKKRGIDL